MPTPAIQAIIQGAPIRVEMKAPQGPGGKSAYQVAVENGFVGTEAQWLASLVGPNTVTSATTTNFTSGNVLFANSGFVGSLSRSGIDTRTSFPNDDVTAATSSPTAGTIVRRDGDGAVSLASSLYEGVTLDVISSGNDYAQAIRGVATGNLGVGGDFKSFSGTAVIAESINGTYHATFGVSGDNRSAIERVRGWFVWFYSTFTGRLKTANITANRDWTLPDSSGTIALTTDIVDSVTSATTSDGTANLSLSNVSTTTATVSGLLTAGHIHGNLAGTLYTHVRTGEAMDKGDPFYISGFHVGSSQPIAMRADAANAAKMPAVGVMDADYANNTSSANGIISGTLSSVNTNGYTVNSPIYVANGGGYSNTAGTIPQQVGITERANANTGAFIVTNSKVISFADVSDAQTGTANLSLGDLEVVGGEIYTDGEYSSIYTQGATAHIFTLGSGAEIYTEGELAQIYTTGASAQIYTAGAGATIGTQGANATIYTQGANATISTAGSAAHIQTSHASAAVKSTNFAAVESGGASLVDGSMQPCLTWSAGGRNLTIPSGTATTFNTTSYTFGTGAASAFVTALGTFNSSTATALQNSRNIFGIAFNGTANVVGDATNTGHFASIPTGGQAGHFITLNGTAPTVIAGRSAWWSDGSGNPSFRNGTGMAVTLVKSSDLGANVANFLEFPTSANLASALTDENGTGGGFVRAEGATLTSPSIAGTASFTGTTRPTSAGTGTPAATSLMTRDDVALEPFYNLGSVFRVSATPAFANSGTGSSSATQSAGDRWAGLSSGTANSGWARAQIGRGITTVPSLSGAGINFASKLGVSIVLWLANSAATDNLNIFRLRFGSDNTPVADGVDAVAYRGFGVEIKARGSSHDWRVYGHNGTSITYSAWSNTGLTADLLRTRIFLSVMSNGSGTITASLGANGSRTLSTITTTGGPTTSGVSAQSYIEVHVANSASGVLSLSAALYDAMFYAQT